MTMYEAWSRGSRWVVCRGLLCRVSLPVSGGDPRYPGKFWVVHLGRRKHPRCRFAWTVTMSEEVEIVEPNSPWFRTLWRL